MANVPGAHASTSSSIDGFSLCFFGGEGGRGERWRRSEHTHASYPGLFFLQPGFKPLFRVRGEQRFQGLDYHKVTPSKNKMFVPIVACEQAPGWF